jgi:hypothetical protein
MRILDGLYLYEIVLLALGVLLFLLLIAVLVMQIRGGKPHARLIPFFGIAVFMMGYPGIKSFELSASEVKIELNTRKLLDDPTNSVLRESLKVEVEKVAARPVRNAITNTAIARAQLALGEEPQAEERLNAVLKVDPTLPAAQGMKEEIFLYRELAILTSKVERDPRDTSAKAQLAAVVRSVSQRKIASPSTQSDMVRAKEALSAPPPTLEK